MALALAKKVALVTGASGAIGAAIARRLASDGAAVIVHYGSGEDSARAVVREIAAGGGEAEAVGADLATPNGALALVSKLDATFAGRFAGRLDILVNNAGIFDFDALAEVTDGAFDRLFTVNVRAVFQLSREAANRMRPRGFGRIVNIGSVFGEAVPSAGLSVYSASKFAVRGLARAWSRDLGPFGITVNTVQPALIQMDPLPTTGPALEAMRRFASVDRFGTPEDVANAVAFLVDPQTSYANGATLSIDGGWSA